MRKTLTGLALLIATNAWAQPWHFRAREHYETTHVETDDGGAKFSGFTNTIDFFYEVERKFSVGIAGSPLLATLKSKTPPPGFGDTIRLVHLGAEGKAFPWEALPVFGRLGAFQTRLNPRGDAGIRTGRSLLIGFGYEFDLGGVSLAPEMSWRRGTLDPGVTFSGVAPAIGVHFYQAI